jgi:hypothetical protein
MSFDLNETITPPFYELFITDDPRLASIKLLQEDLSTGGTSYYNVVPS